MIAHFLTQAAQCVSKFHELDMVRFQPCPFCSVPFECSDGLQPTCLQPLVMARMDFMRKTPQAFGQLPLEKGSIQGEQSEEPTEVSAMIILAKLSVIA